MGYFVENPHVAYNQGAYDYYINEVKTFNERLERYQQEVNQKLSDQDEEIAAFKNTVNGQINDLRGQLRDFETEINNTFSNWTREQMQIFNQELAAFRAEVRSIKEDMVSYIGEHMDEWQVEASTITFTADGVTGLDYYHVGCDKTYSEIVALLSEPALDIVFSYTSRKFKCTGYVRKTNSIVFRFRGFADYGTDTINCTFNVEINTSNEITCTLTDGYIIRELTKTATVAAESNETITFDTLSISVFSKYTILEYGEKYQNKIWVGPQFVGTSPMCLPYLTDESTASNLNLKARVYNPVTSGAIDVTAYAKVLLEL